MLSNPQWCQSVSNIRQTVRLWWITATNDDLMALAIFLDAQPVCGDRALLDQVRAAVYEMTADNDAMLARFAAAANAFGDGNSNGSVWWNRLLHPGDHDKESLNIKKAGTFPLVHGLRSLALAHHIDATSTVERAHALVAMGRLPEKLANDLIESLHFFMGLKLKTGLQQLETGHPVSGEIQLDKLSSLDRDLLKDTLGIVKQFKALLSQRFHLEAM